MELNQESKFTILTHFASIKRSIIIITILFFSLWVLLFCLFPKLIIYFEWPYKKAFPHKELSLVFTSLPEAILAALKTTFFLALVGTLPVAAFQVWKLIAPRLLPEEKRLIRKFMVIITFLFLTGIIFAYFFIIPTFLHFFLSIGYQRFIPYLRIQNYLAFIGKGLALAGLIAQIPGIVAILVKLKLISPKFLRRRCIYFLGIGYALGLFFSPTDLFSQILLALIFYVLLETGFILSRFI